MDPRLQELLDHHEIRQLLATYCHGCDRADEVEMAGTYAADSWDDHGPRKMDGRTFSIATVEESLRTTNLVSHLLGQSLIKVHDDTAGAETYFVATLLYPPNPESYRYWRARGDDIEQRFLNDMANMQATRARIPVIEKLLRSR